MVWPVAGKPGSLPRKSCSLPPHAHAPPITEWLTVREGRMGYLLNGTEGVATAESGSIRTDPGLVHTFWNAVRRINTFLHPQQQS